MYIYIYVYIYICINICVCVYIYVCICMYIYIYIYVYRFMPEIVTLRDHKGSIKGHLGGPGMPWPYGLLCFLSLGFGL